MKTFTTTIVIALALLAPLAASAQALNLGTLEREPNRAHVSTGLEHGLVAGAGYDRVLPFLDRRLVLSLDASLPWAGLDASDYRVQARALVPLVGLGGWRAAGAVAPIVRGTENQISTMTGLGVDVSLTGGWYSGAWFVAGELGVDLALTTHLVHRDAYREHVHEGAVDGWYASPGANLRAGLQLGVSFARYELALRAGQVRDASGEAPVLPLYGTLSLATRW